jgi:hypothetical protein
MYGRIEVLLQIFLVHATVSFNVYLLLLIQEYFSQECYINKLIRMNYFFYSKSCTLFYTLEITNLHEYLKHLKPL